MDLRLDIAIIRAPLASPPDALVVRSVQAVCAVKSSACALSTASAGVGALNLASLRTDNWISPTIRRAPDWAGFYGCLSRRGLYAAVAQRINDVTSMIVPVSAGWEWRWFRSRRGPYLDNVVYRSRDRLAESELSMVYHRHIRSAVVRKSYLAALIPLSDSPG